MSMLHIFRLFLLKILKEISYLVLASLYQSEARNDYILTSRVLRVPETRTHSDPNIVYGISVNIFNEDDNTSLILYEVERTTFLQGSSVKHSFIKESSKQTISNSIGTKLCYSAFFKLNYTVFVL